VGGGGEERPSQERREEKFRTANETKMQTTVARNGAPNSKSWAGPVGNRRRPRKKKRTAIGPKRIQDKGNRPLSAPKCRHLVERGTRELLDERELVVQKQKNSTREKGIIAKGGPRPRQGKEKNAPQFSKDPRRGWTAKANGDLARQKKKGQTCCFRRRRGELC